MLKKIQKFLSEEEGLTTVEYAIAGSLVALGVVSAFSILGDNVQNGIEGLGDAMCDGGTVVGCTVNP